jgi:uncharacterized protein YbbC (DUF1343 family)
MRLKVFKNTVLLFVLAAISCGHQNKDRAKSPADETTAKIEPYKNMSHQEPVVVGANRTDLYLPILKGKRLGIVANQTSVIFKSSKDSSKSTSSSEYTHLVDSLLQHKITVTAVFAPEHGFRGKADAGEDIKDGIDKKTGIPIISLYGNNKKPSASQLKDIDMVVFDIQDVGARFYTYISTLHYIMEACAEQNIPVMVLDRPNPNGHYIDGPVLEKAHKSFVGMHPVPVVHGMTIGEYAKMMNGERWLSDNLVCDLTIIPLKHYSHKTSYSLPIKPSPNLPNDKAINLYPSLCFFEGTNVSVGRGTNKQFQVVGSPFLEAYKFDYTFIPQPNEGAKYPKHNTEVCYGYDLSQVEPVNQLNLRWLLEFYKLTKKLAPNEPFFNDFFTKLAGTKMLQEQIENGLSAEDIKATWQEDLAAFRQTRQKYLLYED